MKITFELTRSDLEHFKQVLHRAREAAQQLTPEQIIENASRVLSKVNGSDTSDFIREQMNKLETLIGMALDEGWGLEDEDRRRIIDAMAYFSETDDLIPDHRTCGICHQMQLPDAANSYPASGCATCHEGYSGGLPEHLGADKMPLPGAPLPEKNSIPAARIVFSHSRVRG